MISVFVSYQKSEEYIADKVSAALESINIYPFLANKRINASENWQSRILSEMSSCDIFICLLSQSYVQSVWCVQETGISAMRKNVTIIPLSIDGTRSPGFISHIQSISIDENNISIMDLIHGIANHDFDFSFNIMLDWLKSVRSFRSAEVEFRNIFPFVGRMSVGQKLQLLKVSIENRQILHANLCRQIYLPPIAKECAHMLDSHEFQLLTSVIPQ